MPPTIIYEDENILACNKPSGQVVIPERTPGGAAPLVEEVGRYLGAKAYVVHRLDRLTSGIILFAKSAAAHRDLCMQFERRRVTKKYLALVQGCMQSDITINKPLRRFGSGRMGIDNAGQEAATEIHVVQASPGRTLLEAFPKTGRQHQIRVHLYSIGHPVIGDPLYGEKRPVGGFARLMLHAAEITFATIDKTSLTLRAQTDEEWKKLCAMNEPQ
ncbi:MAG: RluA family pseudouridine synthase [Chitinivibrionales bacterium]|nr:RluA family pseudouridine synthase [Chitinivibrionales bacterium]